MSIESNLSGHWTDEQLIERLYGVGRADGHFEKCDVCQTRLSAMIAARQRMETDAPFGNQVPFDLLAAQRRSIYDRISQLHRWHAAIQVRRWAGIAALIALVGGGAVLYQQSRDQHQPAQTKVTDAQLAQEVSQMSQDIEPSPTAPLRQLFDE